MLERSKKKAAITQLRMRMKLEASRRYMISALSAKVTPARPFFYAVGT